MTFKELYTDLVKQAKQDHNTNGFIKGICEIHTSNHFSVVEVFPELVEIENNLSYYMEDCGIEDWNGFTWKEDINDYALASEIMELCKKSFADYINEILNNTENYYR